MTVQTVADITPNGTKTKIADSGTPATWIMATASGTSIRIGDVNVSSSRGLALQTGVATRIPATAPPQGDYDLGEWYVYGASGSDKVSITYGR